MILKNLQELDELPFVKIPPIANITPPTSVISAVKPTALITPKITKPVVSESEQLLTNSLRTMYQIATWKQAGFGMATLTDSKKLSMIKDILDKMRNKINF